MSVLLFKSTQSFSQWAVLIAFLIYLTLPALDCTPVVNDKSDDHSKRHQKTPQRHASAKNQTIMPYTELTGGNSTLSTRTSSASGSSTPSSNPKQRSRTPKCSQPAGCSTDPGRQITKNDTVLVINAPSVSKSRGSKSKLKVSLSHLFREEVDNYPEAEIALALKETPDALKDFYNALDSPLDPNRNLTERIASSDDQDGREESICRSVIRNIYPREARRDNSLVYVPNNQDFMQVIQVELCQRPNEECNFLEGNLPEGMTSVCYQKYAYKKLLYLNPLEKRMASDLFRYPSCCSCYIKSTIDLRSSEGGNQSSLHKPQAKDENTIVLNHSSPLGGAIEQSEESSVTQNLGNNLKRQAKLMPPATSTNEQSKFGDLDGPEKLPDQLPAALLEVGNQTVVLDEDRVYKP